jgi:Flp pilus assembly pilin Flp
MKTLIPQPVEVAREAVIVILGALLAAVIVGQLPGVRAWIKRQWDGAPTL